jgi:hypothetical protein
MDVVRDTSEHSRQETEASSYQYCCHEVRGDVRAGGDKVFEEERSGVNAGRQHEIKRKAIERQRFTLDKRAQSEDARWEKQKEKLEAAVGRARS